MVRFSNHCLTGLAPVWWNDPWRASIQMYFFFQRLSNRTGWRHGKINKQVGGLARDEEKVVEYCTKYNSIHNLYVLYMCGCSMYGIYIILTIRLCIMYYNTTMYYVYNVKKIYVHLCASNNEKTFEWSGLMLNFSWRSV